MAVEYTGRLEEDHRYYNRIYARKGGYNTTRFQPIYDVVLDWLVRFPQRQDLSILEVGCGNGALGEQIIGLIADDTLRATYNGFDFSQAGINRCPNRVKKSVWCGSAYDRETWVAHNRNFTCVIAVEVFEHLDDHRILKYIPARTRVIFSVPNFDSKSHLRTYPDTDSVQAYYRGKLGINAVVKIQTSDTKAILVCDAIRQRD
jgi:2-polyprenyl-3-methyl-5-hydroxy-6-metoxy-1,4-benzoquinol methylase